MHDITQGCYHLLNLSGVLLHCHCLLWGSEGVLACSCRPAPPGLLSRYGGGEEAVGIGMEKGILAWSDWSTVFLLRWSVARTTAALLS